MGLFDGLFGGVIGGIGSWLGQRDTNRANRDINRENNQFNAMQNALNRQWQEQMSNTAFQRQRADMEKAGINPILAAGGPGASSPSGSAASAAPSHPQQNVIGPAISTALQIMRAKEELSNLKDTGSVLKSQALLNTTSARRVASEAVISKEREPRERIKSKVWEKANSALDSVERSVARFNKFTDIKDQVSMLHSSALKHSSWGKALNARLHFD